MSKLLLFSLFLFSFAGSGLAATVAERPANPDSPDTTIFSGMPEAPTRFDRIQAGNSVDADHVCLNIHAFIFKTEDDQVPQLVRETTCMPVSGAAAKKVNGSVQPRLVPATGGNSF